MPDPDGTIFGPHEGETYGHYLRRLLAEPVFNVAKAVAMMATAMLMQGNINAAQPVNREQLTKLQKVIRQQPAFEMMRRSGDMDRLMRQGDSMGLIQCMADKAQERQRTFDKYVRPREYIGQDADFLNTVTERLRSKPPKPADGQAGAQDPALEKQTQLYNEMMKRLEAARSKAERGVQLTGEETKNLITAVKAYNDGGAKKLPGGTKQQEGFTEAMCLLSRYMPEQEFRSYCYGMNRARRLERPNQLGYAHPAYFDSDRINGTAMTAAERLERSRTHLMKSFSETSCAEAVAIQKLSGGNPNRLIRQEELDKETLRLLSPGTAFMRAMRDEKTRANMAKLAAAGGSAKLGTDLTRAAREHALKASQWQVNRSIRALTGGPLNEYMAAEHLATVLAARELASGRDAGENITAGAFRDRAEQIRESAAFRRLASRYSHDPSFRRQLNRSLAADNTGQALTDALLREQGPARANRAQQPAPEEDLGLGDLFREPEQQPRQQQPPQQPQQQPQQQNNMPM